MSDPAVQPELLAPAGTLDVALAAFDAGADAVYVGLPRFSARERAGNLTIADLARLLSVARHRGRKVYVALNTLIREAEIPAVIEILAQLLVLRPEAVIVQDLGVLYLIRRHFPELSIHASTQMAVHNSAGINLLQQLGVKRVILERQVTLAELRRIRERTDVELEVFVHGALCCSRSGVCLFSSWLGGWSGNRGKCKQPCRRRFFSPDGNGFFFSTADLYALDILPQLRDLGIASLKIEGRLRQVDDVRSIVGAYRAMLDATPASQSAALAAARARLGGACGRRWSRGFRDVTDFADVVRHRHGGTAGQFLGQVTAMAANGFTVQLTRPLRVGDRLRVQPASGEEGPGFQATRLAVRRRTVTQAGAGVRCFVHCDKPVALAAGVFRTGRATATERAPAAAATLPLRFTADLQICVRRDCLEVGVGGLPAVSWKQSWDLRPARRRSVTAADVAEAFRHTGQAELAVGRADVRIEGRLFLPAAELKAARRRFWAWTAKRVSAGDAATVVKARGAACLAALGPLPAPARPRRDCVVLVTAGARNTRNGTLTAKVMPSSVGRLHEVAVPDFCPEAELAGQRERLARLVGKGIRRFRICSVHGLQLLREAGALKDGVLITASHPLPVANSLALRQLHELGVERGQAWVELARDDVDQLLDAAPGRVELYICGRLPILSTRAVLPVTGPIRDDRGNAYRIVRENDQYLLFPAAVFGMPPQTRAHQFVDLTHAGARDRPTHAFNWEREWR